MGELDRSGGRRGAELDAVPRSAGNARPLDVEAEQQDVAVLDDIFLAFRAHLARVLGAGLAAERDEIVVGDGFGADEPALEVGVDLARGLGRLGAFVDRPGARFLGPGGVESDQAQ